MSADQSHIDQQQAIEQTKLQIRGLVGEIAALSKSNLSPEEYYPEFLQRVVSALAAVGGAVWTLQEGGGLRLMCQINISQSLLDREADDSARHLRLVHHVIRSGEARLAAPQSAVGEDQAVGNPTRYLLVLAPLQQGDQPEGLVEIFQRPDGQPATQRGYLKFLVQMCELAAEWLKNRQLQQFSDRQELWAQLDQFTRAVHESLDVRRTAYAIANEARRVLGVDRVSVALLKGSKCKIEAISGQDTMDSRSNIVSTLARLATRVVATGQPLWYSGGSADDLAPQVEEALEAYIEESHAKSVAVLPVRHTLLEERNAAAARPEDRVGETSVGGELLGAIIIEQIESNLTQRAISPKTDLIFHHSSRALSNALEHHNLFLMPVWKTIGKARWFVTARNLPKTVSISAAVLLVLLAMLLIRVEFNMEGKAELQPVVKHQVFVDVPGVVRQVHVHDGEAVRANDVLVELRNTDLDVQLEDVLGQLAATSKQLDAVSRTLIEARNLSDEERIRLSGQQQEYRLRKQSLEKQRDLLKQKHERLKVRSPISGQVVAWDVENLLQDRPVIEGQVLMTVADLTRDWELDVYLPENRIHHVSQALAALERRKATGAAPPDEQLRATFILNSDPHTRRTGTVREVHHAGEMHPEHGHAVRIKIAFDRNDPDAPLKDPYPGGTATVDIHCGRAPVAYSWFHEALEWFLRDVWF